MERWIYWSLITLGIYENLKRYKKWGMDVKVGMGIS
jgi:hypothetical protein